MDAERHERAPAGRPSRVLTYSHDGYGLGHLRRNLRVIGGLLDQRPGLSVLAVTGCKVAHQFHYPPGVDYLRLPAVTKVANERYVADGLEIAAEDVSSLRASIITAAIDRFEPDLVVVDRHPMGLNGELADGLRLLRSRRPAARIVLGLRDIIDEPRAVGVEWREKGHTAVIETFYDSVMVYGTQSVYDVVERYRLPPSVAAKVRFTGYLGDDSPVVCGRAIRRQLEVPDGARLAVCTLGGGKDALHVAVAFLESMTVLSTRGWRGLLVTGPYMSDHDCGWLADGASGMAVTIRRFVSELPSHLAAADAVLCMGGYNTLCEALSVGASVVVVPRVRPRLEQAIRADALAARGLVRRIHPDAVSGDLVARELESASVADRDARLRAFDSLGRGGIREAAVHLDRMLRDTAPGVRPVPVAR